MIGQTISHNDNVVAATFRLRYVARNADVKSAPTKDKI